MYLFMGMVIIFSFFVFFNRDKDGFVLNYQWVNVLTNSMDSNRSDGFSQGDLIIVKRVKIDTLAEDDIISYKIGSQNTLTHRIQSISLNEENEKEFITKGDANSSVDPPVNEEKVIGKVVFSIPKLGSLLWNLRKYWYIVLSSILTIYVLIEYILYSRKKKVKGALSHGRKRKKKGKKKKKKTKHRTTAQNKKSKSKKEKNKSHVKKKKETKK